ncbi:hypothetical protein F5B17DRAFT_34203 [Nemania serpens]|nr:hypothetical protein F5B17DRAFT_34203 [Nemania serpens]
MSSTSTPTSASSPSSSPSSSPTVRHPNTGCTATLSAGLAPLRISHTARCKCKCICVSASTIDSSPAKEKEEDDDEEEENMARLASSVRVALAEGILESEKPALAFAMLLLGAEVVY